MSVAPDDVVLGWHDAYKTGWHSGSNCLFRCWDKVLDHVDVGTAHLDRAGNAPSVHLGEAAPVCCQFAHAHVLPGAKRLKLGNDERIDAVQCSLDRSVLLAVLAVLVVLVAHAGNSFHWRLSMTGSEIFLPLMTVCL